MVPPKGTKLKSTEIKFRVRFSYVNISTFSKTYPLGPEILVECMDIQTLSMDSSYKILV